MANAAYINAQRNLAPSDQKDSNYFKLGGSCRDEKEKALRGKDLRVYQNNAGLHKLSFKDLFKYFELWVK